MQVVVLYDISDDRVRGKVADACLDYGLDRFQYSAFVGELSRNYQEELLDLAEDLLGDSVGRICLLPIAIDDWESRAEVGNV